MNSVAVLDSYAEDMTASINLHTMCTTVLDGGDVDIALTGRTGFPGR